MPTPSAMPARQARHCTRYTRDGHPCTRTTERHDRWCGECDGYPDTRATVQGDASRHAAWFVRAKSPGAWVRGSRRRWSTTPGSRCPGESRSGSTRAAAGTTCRHWRSDGSHSLG